MERQDQSASPSTSSTSSQSMDTEGFTDHTENETPPTPNEERMMTILDGKFFKLLPEKSTRQNLVSVCVKCQPIQVEIRGYRNSTTNFLAHLRRKHGQQALDEYTAYKRMKLDERVHTTFRREPSSTPLNQDDFENLLSRFIINSMVPFRVVEDTWLGEIFKRLKIGRAGLNVPSRRALVRHVEKTYQEHILNVHSLLKDVEYVCTTADIWSGKRRSFLGVTCHWIKENYERESVALACRRFKNSHTFDRIANLLEDIHSSFGLGSPKIVATVTDNGSNFVKAFKEFGVDNRIIALSDCNGFPEDGETLHDDDEDSDSSSGSDSDSASPQVPVESFLPDHVRCCSHTLNLCATTDINKTIDANPSLKSMHKSVISKCNLLWSLASRPKSAEIVLEVLRHSLSRPCETRWNSLYDALKQIQSDEEKYSQLYRHLKVRQSLQLTKNDFLYMKEYVECSTPLTILLDILQSEKNVFFGMLLPSLLSLEAKLRALQQKPWVYCQEIIDSYVSSIKKRFAHFFDISTSLAETATIAAFSNPLFKKRWLTSLPIEHRDKALKIFTTAVTRIITESQEEAPNQEGIEGEIPPSYFDFFEFGSNEEPPSPAFRNESRAQVQISSYFEDRSIALDMLDNYPYIKRIFFQTNTIIPSSAPVERLFSFASMTNNPKANRLSDRNFEIRVVLKANGFNFDKR